MPTAADINSILKLFIFFGLLFLVIGSVLYVLGRAGINLGKLPGDILIQKDNFTFYFPLVTSIIVSIVLTLFFNFIQKR